MKTDKFTQMGVLSLIPGMEYMIDLMQQEITRMRQTVQAMQSSPDGAVVPFKKKSGWDGMTREERSAEMQRRRLLWTDPKRPRKSTGARPIVRDDDGRRNAWARMSPAKRKQRIANMAAARQKARAAEASK